MCKTAIYYETGHEYIDLGLSVKWATCNIGAETPDGYGRRYLWDKNNKQRYDTASYKWQGRWRLPTVEEFRELIDNCSYEWEEQGDVCGIRFTSTKPRFEGNSIFLRASGFYDIDNDGPYEYGMYRTANLSTNEASQYQKAQILVFEKGLSSKCEFTFVSLDFYPWACVRPVF